MFRGSIQRGMVFTCQSQGGLATCGGAAGFVRTELWASGSVWGAPWEESIAAGPRGLFNSNYPPYNFPKRKEPIGSLRPRPHTDSLNLLIASLSNRLRRRCGAVSCRE